VIEGRLLGPSALSAMVQFLLDFSRGLGAAKGMQNSRRSSGRHHLDLKVALSH
jgi:hypothetical protein